MPHTHTGLPSSSGFDSFSIPLHNRPSASSSLSQAQSQQPIQYPQSTTVAWTSGSTNLASSSFPYTPKSAMSSVAGPSPLNMSHTPFSSSSQHGSINSGLYNATSAAANWNSSPASHFAYPGSTAGFSGTSQAQQPQRPGHHSSLHQHSSSLDGNMQQNPISSSSTSADAASFGAHRRMATDSNLLFPAGATAPASEQGGHYVFSQNDQQSKVEQSPQAQSTPLSKPFTLGPVRVHQLFPTAGESGVPVTVLATVNSEWARQIGLRLAEGIFGSGNGNDDQSGRQLGGSRFVVCFGPTEVEARTERSISTTESPFSTLTTLEGTAYQSGSTREIDLTIHVHAPNYPGPQLQYPNLGGRVPVRIKLVNAPPLDPSLQALTTTGVQVGEYCYWQVSPRSNLKRHGDDLLDEQHALRRPASFPVLGHGNGPQQHQAQQAGQNAQNPLFKRPGLGHSDSIGLSRMASAHDFRSPAVHGANLTTGLDVGDTSGNAYGQAFTTTSLPSTSPGSSKRRTSLSFSSAGGMGPTSDTSRPSSDLTPFHKGASEQQQHSGYMSGAPNPTPMLVRSTQLFSPPAGSSSEHTAMGGSSSIAGSAASVTGGGHQYNPSSVSNSSNSPSTDRSGLPLPHSQRATLELHGNVQDMAVGWSHDEWRARRRLVQFWRKQEGTTIHAICKPILPEQYVPNSVVVSCIFWDVTNECYITSVDIIYLLEALVASRFNVEEKNRIRRNLEGLKPKTISKIAKSEDANLNKIHEEFFKLVMSFPNPKPRHIEKDIKIFPWRVVASALNKIISKYSAAPLMAASSTSTPTPASTGMMSGHPHAMSATPTSGMPLNLYGHGQSTPGIQSSSMLMSGIDAGGPNTAPSFASPHLMQQQQQQQQQQQARRFQAPGLSIDVGVSNAAFAPQSAPPIGQFGGGQPQSMVFPSPGRGLGIGLPSPRKSMNLGLPSSSTFNFSDFVVSPSAFGQTPLQQAQNLSGSSGGPNAASQPPSQSQHGQGAPSFAASAAQSHHGGGGSGLGMDLGAVYKQEH